METRITTTTPPEANPSPRSDEISRKEEAARKAGYEIVGPRVYRMSGISTNPVRFFVLGCHGNGQDSQKNTAALMNHVAQELKDSGEPTPSFMLFLGDNIYDYGVSSPFDQAFDECFDSIYYDVNLPSIKLPSWLLLGNHDFNMHSKAWLGKFGKGEEVAINQVGHTFFASTVDGINKKAAIFTNEELAADKLPHWNMPYFFYSLIAGNTQIFCLDSNNFVADYLDLLNGNVGADGKNIYTKHVNQAAWFFAEYAKAMAEGRQIFVAQHHPFFVSGKRAFPEGYDWKHYINEYQLNDINAKLRAKIPGFVETKSYNSLLAGIFQAQGIDPDVIFAAHEHFQSYYNNMESDAKFPLRQLTSGGGGGDLQKRLSYAGHPYVSVFQKHNGFTMVTCDPAYPNTYTFDTYTTEGLHLRFREDSHHPVMNENPDPQVEMLRTCVIDACDSYLNLLKNAELQHAAAERNSKKSAENTGLFAAAYRMFSDTFSSLYSAASALLDHLYPNSNSEKENSTVQDIQAYFSQLDLRDYKTVLTELFKLTRQLPYRTNENEYTFYTILQRHVKMQSHQDLETLFINAGMHDIFTYDQNSAPSFKTSH